jgi:hypothetical protein
MEELDRITIDPEICLGWSVRKFPEMADLPGEELGPDWLEKEEQVNRDKRPGVKAASPAEALKRC